MNKIKICLVALIFLIVITGCKTKKIEEIFDEHIPIISMILLGDEYPTLNIDEEYIEEGVIVLVDEIETNEEYEIIGRVDTSIPGEYTITYKYQEIEIKRIITVIDNIPPVIKLIGAKSIILVEGDIYKEYGYSASDNVDGDITSKVTVSGTVKKTIGTYILTYTVKDSSGNETSVKRTVKVNKKLVPKEEPKEEKVKEEEKPIVFKNEVIDMILTDAGFKIILTYEKEINSIHLLNTATDDKTEYTVIKNKNFESSVDLTSLPNGNYKLYLKSSDNEEAIKNNLNNLLRIKKMKLGSKLVTFSYPDNTVVITIENHAYKYDLLIDVGHGPTPGAVNSTHIERDINLVLSLYEKERYESHGLKVLLTRTGFNPDLGEGDSDWAELSRRAYAMGYYGTVSKIVYSNHHNGSNNSTVKGPEIIVPASLDKSALAPELKIIDEWKKLTGVTDGNRFWSRNYDTGSIHSKINGEIYAFTNWYAVIRIPYNLFRVKSVIYEPVYMSNASEWNWYWNEENWKAMCEVKIKSYVESIGVAYIPPIEEGITEP